MAISTSSDLSAMHFVFEILTRQPKTLMLQLRLLALATVVVCATSAAFLEMPQLNKVLPPTVMLPREPQKCCLANAFQIRRHENSLLRGKRGDELVTELSHLAVDKKVLKVAKVCIL